MAAQDAVLWVYLAYSSAASTNCPQESKSFAFSKETYHWLIVLDFSVMLPSGVLEDRLDPSRI